MAYNMIFMHAVLVSIGTGHRMYLSVLNMLCVVVIPAINWAGKHWWRTWNTNSNAALVYNLGADFYEKNAEIAGWWCFWFVTQCCVTQADILGQIPRQPWFHTMTFCISEANVTHPGAEAPPSRQHFPNQAGSRVFAYNRFHSHQPQTEIWRDSLLLYLSEPAPGCLTKGLSE